METTYEMVLKWAEKYGICDPFIVFPYDFLKFIRKMEKEGILEIVEIDKPILVTAKFI